MLSALGEGRNLSQTAVLPCCVADLRHRRNILYYFSNFLAWVHTEKNDHWWDVFGVEEAPEESPIWPNIKKAMYFAVSQSQTSINFPVCCQQLNFAHLHPSMQFAPVRFSQTCLVRLDGGQITFPSQTNCSRIGLWLDRNHFLERVLMQYDCCVQMCSNKRGEMNQSAIQLD